ncbi:hypothetical protein HanIR_Chr09g0427151 [Helianthus annuus]|nr:hypothetical protein HanIR_Chr09g0427151 [Helianthus annuus]
MPANPWNRTKHWGKRHTDNITESIFYKKTIRQKHILQRYKTFRYNALISKMSISAKNIALLTCPNL